MDEHFTPLTDDDAFEALVARSQAEPVVLFKHDPVCSISLVAYHELRRMDETFPLIDVSRSHALSRLVADQTGVKHESPQVIVLRNGAAVWSASHYAIKAAAVEQAVRDNS